MAGRQHHHRPPLSRAPGIYSSRPWTASTGRSPLTEVPSSILDEGEEDKLTRPPVSSRSSPGRHQRKAGLRHAIVESTGEGDTNLQRVRHSSKTVNSKSVDNIKEKAGGVEEPMSTKPDDAPANNTAKPETNGAIVIDENSSAITITNQVNTTTSKFSKFLCACCPSRCRKAKVADSSPTNTLTDSAAEADNKAEPPKPPETAETTEPTKFSLRHFFKTLVFDRTASKFYFWLAAISIAYVYNLTVVIARSVFKDLNSGPLWVIWLAFDAVADMFYLDFLTRVC
uniref:Cyclic nucleotide-binding domain-containing protein n=1 Tax=Panagrellus redivivus TaxID=6233 RepID=A0A7E4W370_PANRE